MADWENERIEKMIIVAWAVWTIPNEIQTGGAKKSSQKLVTGALEYLAQYQECVWEPEKPNTVLPVHWMPPPWNKFKINIDGAVFASQKAAGVGVLVRDAAGSTIGAYSKKIWAPLGAVEVEAKTGEIGLQFTKDLLIQENL